MARLQGAAAQTAAGEVVSPVQAQCCERLEATQQRCETKQRAAQVLARQVARQLLAAQVRQREADLLQQAEALLAATEEDVSSVLEATWRRSQQLQVTAAVQGCAEGPAEGGAHGVGPVETARELQRCLVEFLQLGARLEEEALPANRQGFAWHFGALFEAGDLDRPLLTPAPLAARLAEVGPKAAALEKRVAVVMDQVEDRARFEAQHTLREQVLVAFFTKPDDLPELAALQARELAATGRAAQRAT